MTIGDLLDPGAVALRAGAPGKRQALSLVADVAAVAALTAFCWPVAALTFFMTLPWPRMEGSARQRLKPFKLTSASTVLNALPRSAPANDRRNLLPPF